MPVFRFPCAWRVFPKKFVPEKRRKIMSYGYHGAKSLAIEGELVLGADTVVVLDEHILEKPRDQDDAARVLRLLSGRLAHRLDGWCVLGCTTEFSDTCATLVQFTILSEPEIVANVASGEPMDKAGAYAIQGLASEVY